MTKTVARSIARPIAGAIVISLLTAATGAYAQEPPPAPPPGFEQTQPAQPAPAQPPPGYAAPPGYPPPPGYAPPPGYYPPPGYGYGVPPQAMLGPKKMEYEEGDPIPPGYHVETKMKKGLFIGGTVTFATCWFFSAFTAAAASDTGSSTSFAPLYIPAVGPFIAIGTTHSQSTGTFLLVVDGVAQAGGLAMAIAGLALHDSELVRNDVGKLHVTPLVSPTVAGLGITGSL